MTAPVWSMAETHCVLCLRPFPGLIELEREKQPDESGSAWWMDFCWRNHGGFCSTTADGIEPEALLVELRGQNEALSDEVMRLRGAHETEAAQREAYQREVDRLTALIATTRDGDAVAEALFKALDDLADAQPPTAGEVLARLRADKSMDGIEAWAPDTGWGGNAWCCWACLAAEIEEASPDPSTPQPGLRLVPAEGPAALVEDR